MNRWLYVFFLIPIYLLATDRPKETPPPHPLGIPIVKWPDDNPYSQKKVELGKLLFFDKRLSSDASISCASCHLPIDAFSDVNPVSTGIHGHKGTRNAPTVINTCYLPLLFWDGRANSLEDQAKGPLSNPKEMTLAPNPKDAYKECQTCIYEIPGYRKMFQEAFENDRCSIDEISQAIAAFERTVLSGNSAYDRYVAGEKTALSKEQIEGLRIFKKLGCDNCHGGPIFTDGRFMNIGVGMDKPNPDLGRYEITKNEKDKGAFKTPTLRDVSKTAPYMHDGSLKTLAEVIDYYDRGGHPNPWLSPLMKPLHLKPEEKKALVSFLEALDGEGWQMEVPQSFPK